MGADSYLRAVRLLDRPAVLQVRGLTPPGAGEDDATPACAAEAPAQLVVSVHGDGLGPAHLAAATHVARRVFGTDIDLAPLAPVAAADPVFAAVAERFRGLRPVLIADPFETLIWAILGQQINVRFAAKLKRALVERYGVRVPWSRADGPTPADDPGGVPSDLLLFPDPETLSGLSHERDLRPLQFSRQKSEYTVLAARAIAGGALDLDAVAAAG
ncbi:MAG: hypothetical protein U0531_15760, partial [Dehalococcoidia bacterium]